MTDDELIADFLRKKGARVANGRLDYDQEFIMAPTKYSKKIQKRARDAQAQRRKVIEALPRRKVFV